MNGYSAFTHGTPTSVTATEDTVTITATKGESGRVGFNITLQTVNAWIALGYEFVEFTVNCDSPYFNVHCNFTSYTSGYAELVFVDTALIKHGSDGAYYANGSTMKVNLAEWKKYKSEMMADVGLKFVPLSGSNWSDTYLNDVTVTLSNIKFS